MGKFFYKVLDFLYIIIVCFPVAISFYLIFTISYEIFRLFNFLINIKYRIKKNNFLKPLKNRI